MEEFRAGIRGGNGFYGRAQAVERASLARPWSAGDTSRCTPYVYQRPVWKRLSFYTSERSQDEDYEQNRENFYYPTENYRNSIDNNVFDLFIIGRGLEAFIHDRAVYSDVGRSCCPIDMRGLYVRVSASVSKECYQKI